MPDAFVGRQPIFNRKLEVVGYELLFRGAGYLDEAVYTTAEQATATVVLNALTELELPRIVGRRAAWVNVSREFLLTELAQAVPSEQIGLEISATDEIDDELLGALRAMKRAGYRLSMDGFAWQPAAERALELCDMVKINVDGLPAEELSGSVARLQMRGCQVVAERVRTVEDHERSQSAGCELFQGYFFCRPSVLARRSVAPNRLALLQVISAVHEPEVELEDLERLISRDVSLSFRLLRYVNSAYFGLRAEVRSVGQALALLGVENVRRWVTLSALATIDDKPTELMVTALIRARFCELAGSRLGVAGGPELFTLGLFSVLDGMMDAPMSDLVESLPLAEDVRDALVLRRGDRGQLLDSVESLELGEAATATAVLEAPGSLFLDSVMWANAAAESLFGDLGGAAAPIPVDMARTERRAASPAASAEASVAPPGVVAADAAARAPRAGWLARLRAFFSRSKR